MHVKSIAVGHVEQLQEVSFCHIHEDRKAVHRVVIAGSRRCKVVQKFWDLCEECFQEYGQYFLTEVAPGEN
jgi:hypothetical protein